MIGLSDLMLSNHGTLRGDPASTSGMWGIYASHNEGQSTSFDSSDWMEYQEPKAYLESLKRKQAVVEARDHAGQTPYYDGPQRQLKSVADLSIMVVLQLHLRWTTTTDVVLTQRGRINKKTPAVINIPAATPSKARVVISICRLMT